jgi:hypothetical protein
MHLHKGILDYCRIGQYHGVLGFSVEVIHLEIPHKRNSSLPTIRQFNINSRISDTAWSDVNKIASVQLMIRK